MSRTKLVGILAVGLLLSNLLLAGYILFRRPPHADLGGPRSIIIEKLHFDEAQQRQYDELIYRHRSEIGKAEDVVMQLKQQLYRKLAGADTAGKDSIINELGKMQMHMERVHYKHFTDIKNLCRPDQLRYYDQLTHEIAGLFGPPQINRRHP